MINSIQFQNIIDSFNQIDVTDRASVVSAICSVISLVAIVILLVERFERKRPYLQISLEPLRSNLVCIVLRNVGEVGLKLKSIKFDDDFMSQLNNKDKIENLINDDLDVFIAPDKFWVISLDKTLCDVLNYSNKKLKINVEFCKNGHVRNKKYKLNETINFESYKDFLLYISDTDEIRTELCKIQKSLDKVCENLKEN